MEKIYSCSSNIVDSDTLKLYSSQQGENRIEKNIVKVGNRIISAAPKLGVIPIIDNTLRRMSLSLCNMARPAAPANPDVTAQAMSAWSRSLCSVAGEQRFRYSDYIERKEQPPKPFLSVPDELHLPLLGKTVRPQVADRSMHKIIYDGNGKIYGLNEYLSITEYCIIKEALIPGLSVTPEKNRDGIIRTAAEGLIDFAGLLYNYDCPQSLKSGLMERIKGFYLSSMVSVQTLKNISDIVAMKLPYANMLVKMLNDIISTVENQFFVTRHNDNYYGRLFDSQFAKYLIENPSKEMLCVAELIKKEIIKDFSSYTSAEEKETICAQVAGYMRGDIAPWRVEIPEAEDFLNTELPENFLKMLNTEHEYAHLLMVHLVVKYIITAPGYRSLRHAATKLCVEAFLPQRIRSPHDTSLLISQRTGILLHYQNPERVGPDMPVATRPVDQYQLQVNAITPHDQQALTHERPIGTGMSGSANILNYLFLELKKKDYDFSIEQGQLLTAACLTFSGGHSINEAYTVFRYQPGENFKPLSYDKFYQHDELAKKAVDHAYDRLVEKSVQLNNFFIFPDQKKTRANSDILHFTPAFHALPDNASSLS